MCLSTCDESSIAIAFEPTCDYALPTGAVIRLISGLAWPGLFIHLRYNAAMHTRLNFFLIFAIAALAAWPPLSAATFELPSANEAVVGEPMKVAARYEDTLVDLARRNSLGFDEIRHANPKVDAWLPGAGTEVVLPTQFMLPDAPRKGIVVNTAEKRLYYYPKARVGAQPQVVTYPISIGRGDWETPLVTTKITSKVKDPTWYPPESVRKEHAAEGDILPKAVPPGPRNPLGQYALHLGLESYLIHGTNKPFGIGMQVTHGCIRLYPEEIEALFQSVEVGTPVRIVDQPYKAGWLGDTLYLEAHAPLGGTVKANAAQNLTPVVGQVISATKGREDYPIDWNKVRRVVNDQAGVPIAISREGQQHPAASTSIAQSGTPASAETQ
jgi:L,D-transpeptidase ErfK/SrfK